MTNTEVIVQCLGRLRTSVSPTIHPEPAFDLQPVSMSA